MPARRALSAVLLAVLAPLTAVLAVTWGRAPGPLAAAAAVQHADGFAGTVDGWRSWYGSYLLGDLGRAWCVDHGIRAPDADLGYVPTALDDHAPDTRRALAWAVSRGADPGDRVGAAAVMLALHHLAGAVYPAGPLDVTGLDPAALSGFEGHEAEVVARARAVLSDAVAHASLVPPLAITVAPDGPVPAVGAAGTVVARLTDAAGRPVAGELVHAAVTGAALTADVETTTDADGVARFPFEAGAGDNRFVVSAHLPDLEVHAFAPTRAAAQRVVVPAFVDVVGESSFAAVPVHAITIHKTGDDEAWHPVAGARFSIDGGPEIVVGEGGTTPPALVPPGTHQVVETAPPEGYLPAGPWQVEVTDADVTLDVHDAIRRGRIAVHKVDAATGDPLTGAVFTARFDADADGTFETSVDLTADLLPGRYQITEATPPPGYRPAADPVVVDVAPGSTADVVVPDEALPPPPTSTTAPTTTTSTPSPATSVVATAVEDTGAAPPPPVSPPLAPPASPAPPPLAPPELPRTGPALVAPLAVAGLGLSGAGCLLVAVAMPATTEASSSGRRGRRADRRPPSS